MPYTLPQDFTSFILMREEKPDIWMIKKTDWIVQNNGMVLVNVHPDYISFNDTLSRENFPIEIYKLFLNHFITHYQGKYLNITPGQLAIFLRRNMIND